MLFEVQFTEAFHLPKVLTDLYEVRNTVVELKREKRKKAKPSIQCSPLNCQLKTCNTS